LSGHAHALRHANLQHQARNQRCRSSQLALGTISACSQGLVSNHAGNHASKMGPSGRLPALQTCELGSAAACRGREFLGSSCTKTLSDGVSDPTHSVYAATSKIELQGERCGLMVLHIAGLKNPFADPSPHPHVRCSSAARCSQPSNRWTFDPGPSSLRRLSSRFLPCDRNPVTKSCGKKLFFFRNPFYYTPKTKGNCQIVEIDE
jgi:hypothetical protein